MTPPTRRRRLLAGAALTLLGLAVPATAATAALPDDRAWEMVSPVEKNGGGVALAAEAGAGAFGAAEQGGAVAYASAASFGDAQGAAPYSQYLARRGGAGWVTENITPAHLSGAYEGSPYLAFSADLARALLLKPSRSAECDPCPPGYLVRDNDTGQIVGELADPSEFEPVAPAIFFYLEADHLYRSDGGVATDLTPSGGVLALLGGAADGSRAYYATAAGLQLWRSAAGVSQVLASTKLTDLAAATAAVTADGSRAYFTTDSGLFLSDTNSDADVYQWQLHGTGSCAKAPGCLDLISSGRSEGGATFVGASAGGSDVFFTTDRSLVSADPGAVDLYDARVGGGFPPPVEPILCQGDSCQPLPPSPSDPALSTLAAGPGNPALAYTRYRRRGRNCAGFARRARKLRRAARRSRSAGKQARAKRHAKRARHAAKAAKRCRAAKRRRRR